MTWRKEPPTAVMVQERLKQTAHPFIYTRDVGADDDEVAVEVRLSEDDESIVEIFDYMGAEWIEPPDGSEWGPWVLTSAEEAARDAEIARLAAENAALKARCEAMGAAMSGALVELRNYEAEALEYEAAEGLDALRATIAACQPHALDAAAKVIEAARELAACKHDGENAYDPERCPDCGALRGPGAVQTPDLVHNVKQDVRALNGAR